MIKVIASDMDGTLLGDDHRVAPETAAAIRDACEAGIRFMVSTGRNFLGAMDELKDAELVCDYIVSSGAEVRNPKQEVVMCTPMSREMCRKIWKVIKGIPMTVMICTEGADYRIGTSEKIAEELLEEFLFFHPGMTREDAKNTCQYAEMRERTKVASDLEELEAAGIKMYKFFLFSQNPEILKKIEEALEGEKDIAVTSSGPENLEITNVRAQKGPVLKTYIESLGYTMDEVMALGDSLNDLSMLSMDFGATVAMENADPRVKQAAKYITKSNAQLGVAYAIRELLKHRDEAVNETRN